MKILYVTDQAIEAPCGEVYPRIELYADSALGRNRQPLFLPELAPAWEGEVSVAVRIGRLGRDVAPKFAMRYVDAVSLAHVLRPAASEFADMALVDGSVICGDWLEIADGAIPPLEVSLGSADPRHIEIDRQELSQYINKISRLATVKTGDIIILAKTRQRTELAIDSYVTGNINSVECLKFKVK